MEKQRPAAKTILDAVVEAMYAAQEPLDDSLVLVPSVYDLRLHPRAYEELQPLLKRIREQAVVRLEAELSSLNSIRAGPFAALRRLFRPLLRLLFVEARLDRRHRRGAQYERVGERWQVDIDVTADPEADLDYLVVETSFGGQAQAALKGHPTLTIRRRTTLLPNGRYETVLSLPRVGAARGKSAATGTLSDSASGSASGAVSSVLARLSFTDNRGHHVYYMRKDRIVIGRQDDVPRALDIGLVTLPDVSREHAHIRHDPASGTFAFKNLSRYGATINGERVEPSGGGEKDPEVWVSLPPRAEIGLADAVFIQFEAL